MGNADGGGFGDSGVADQNGLHFRRANPLAGDFQGVVGAAQNVPQAVFVNGGKVAVDPDVFKARPVGFNVTLRVFPEAARHPYPRLPNSQLAHAAPHRVPFFIHYIAGHTGNWAGEGAGFQRQQHIAHHNAAGNFCAAGIVDDGQFPFAHRVEKPQPGIGVPGFAGGSKQSQAAGIVALDRLFAVSHQRADKRGRYAQRGDAVSLHQFPQAVNIGIIGRAIENEH